MTERSGTYLVTHADASSAVVRDVETAQVHALSSNPGIEAGDVLEATLASEPPMGVTWRLEELECRRRIDLVDSDLEPTRRSIELARDADVGELRRDDRAGAGEIHVLWLPQADVREAATDVLEDEETLARAARLDAVRVEVRTAPAEGVLSVRYLPD